uniref:Uncharacterized protein n=1 Tax=Anguilla anguilla TaxID=7936 RepID=A0A0E9P9N8_ANGAN
MTRNKLFFYKCILAKCYF